MNREELTECRFEGVSVLCRNRDEAERLYEEIFAEDAYRPNLDTAAPTIIDCGSHIGLSVAYFKLRFPHARVIAIEANPDNFQILELNVQRMQLKHVQLVHGALCARDGMIPFYTSLDRQRPFTWGDTVIRDMWGDKDPKTPIVVPAVRLSDFLDRPIDWLKLDVEGAEHEVLAEARPRLGAVAGMTIEFHGTARNPLLRGVEIADLLHASGFELEVTCDGSSTTMDALSEPYPVYANIRAQRARRGLQAADGARLDARLDPSRGQDAAGSRGIRQR